MFLVVMNLWYLFFSSRRRHTRCALVTGVQTCALPISDAERDARRQAYWQPYHDQLRNEIERLRERHGKVLLWEAHSIASLIPRLFDGKLPEDRKSACRERVCQYV